MNITLDNKLSKVIKSSKLLNLETLSTQRFIDQTATDREYNFNTALEVYLKALSARLSKLNGIEPVNKPSGIIVIATNPTEYKYSITLHFIINSKSYQLIFMTDNNKLHYEILKSGVTIKKTVLRALSTQSIIRIISSQTAS